MGFLDDEVARIAEDPSKSVADVRAAESFRLTWENQWRGQVNRLVAERRSASNEKRSRLYDAIREQQKAIDADTRALDAGELSTAEFMNRRRQHLRKLGEFERRYAGIEGSEKLAADMAGDPVGYMESFFDKWTVLSHQRPSIDAWIDEDRRTRNRR